MQFLSCPAVDAILVEYAYVAARLGLRILRRGYAFALIEKDAEEVLPKGVPFQMSYSDLGKSLAMLLQVNQKIAAVTRSGPRRRR